MGSIRLASLFLTLPTLALTGQQVISSDGNDASRAFRSDGPARSFKRAARAKAFSMVI